MEARKAMNITSPGDRGLNIVMKTSNPLHMADTVSRPQDDDVAGSFADVLKSAINKVNDLQVDAEDMTQKMIYQPESVDIHSVMIATQKAEIAFTFAKSVRDEAIRAYRELMNMR